MIFGPLRSVCSRFADSISIDNLNIELVDKVKFLGIFLGSSLSWREHVSQISLTISRNIGIISKLRYKLPADALLILYNTLILPHLMYCIIVWGSAGKNLMDRLFKLQKRSIRVITYSSYTAHTGPLFSKLGILKIDDIYTLQVLLFVYNCRYPPCSKSKCSFFYRYSFLFYNSNYSTRFSKKMLHIPYFRTEIRRYSISCIGAILFNKFLSLSEASTHLAMKRQIKSFLQSSY